jgi:hypothetical protein
MTDPLALPETVQRLVEATLRSEAQTSTSLRQAVADRAATLAGQTRAPDDLPAALVGYVDKVAQHAYKITDEDITALREAGYSEDELFELTVATALGASLARFEQGLSALREAVG